MKICFVLASIYLFALNQCIECRNFSCHTSAKESRKSQHFSTEIVKDEFIVKFKKYLNKIERYTILNQLLESHRIDQFKIHEKHHLVDNLPSDFDVVQINSSDCWNFNPGLVNKHIKGVHPQSKIKRRSLIHTKQVKAKKNKKKIVDENLADSTGTEYGFDENEQSNVTSNRLNVRKLFKAIPKQLIDQINVKYLWERGLKGTNVNVAIFDTGLEHDHPHFKHVIERIDWTDMKNADDHIGHGTFVAGVIASNKECMGIAPDANLYIFKVFTDNQISYTSWFLDAFNYAISKKIDVLNLSIGGPDFMDQLFVNKVWEITSNNIVMVSGIGNDGPLYGTLNNPADQLDVIGVGGINNEDQIAKFSSRGMTTWELPDGYGRVKPDIVTYSTHLRGSKLKGGCQTLSGTSVASPIVTGSIVLLQSYYKTRRHLTNPLNPGSIKQIIMASADRIPVANIFEQGYGKLNLVEAYKVMNKYKPQASLIPSYIDLTECPYFWPYCSQPIYYTGLPLIFNVTILNGINVLGKINQAPKWQPSVDKSGHFLKLNFTYSTTLWPWSGFLAIKVEVEEEAKNYDGIVEGLISLIVSSSVDGEKLESELNLFVRAKIIPTPPRQQRLLWDQFHNLRYPSGYFPRDDLRMKNDPLDWNGDHLHTNFKDMYQYLRNAGYFIEILGSFFNCFDAKNYGALLIFDSEEEFHPDEITKLYEDISSNGLSLIVFADWYNTSVIKEAKFYDENTRQWWTPLTGGSNVPALNDLLKPFDIALGDQIYEGEFKIGDHTAYYASGTKIIQFPNNEQSYLLFREMKDQGEVFLAEAKNSTVPNLPNQNIALLGLTQVDTPSGRSGRIVVYGDSNCVDSSHMEKDCFWLLSAIIEYACHNVIYSPFKENQNQAPMIASGQLPQKINSQAFNKFSKVDRNKQVKCLAIEYSTQYAIDTIPDKYIPKKENLYNFLVLNNQIGNGEDEEEKRHLNAEYNYQESENGFNPEEQSQFDKIWSTAIESKFPLLTTLAIVLMLFFYAFKFYRKFFRLSYYKRTIQKKFSKSITSSKKKFSKS